MISPRRAMKLLMVKRNVYVAGHKTSVTLEDGFWEGLLDSAEERGVSPWELITSINATRRHANLSSAVRLFVLKQPPIAAQAERMKKKEPQMDSVPHIRGSPAATARNVAAFARPL